MLLFLELTPILTLLVHLDGDLRGEGIRLINHLLSQTFMPMFLMGTAARRLRHLTGQDAGDVELCIRLAFRSSFIL